MNLNLQFSAFKMCEISNSINLQITSKNLKMKMNRPKRQNIKLDGKKSLKLQLIKHPNF